MKKKIQQKIDALYAQVKELEGQYEHYVLVMDWKIAIAKIQLLTELIKEL